MSKRKWRARDLASIWSILPFYNLRGRHYSLPTHKRKPRRAQQRGYVRGELLHVPGCGFTRTRCMSMPFGTSAAASTIIALQKTAEFVASMLTTPWVTLPVFKRLTDLVNRLDAKPPHRVPGTAIFLTGDPEGAPTALLHNLKHNKIIHERNIILTIRTEGTPRVPSRNRVAIDELSERHCHGNRHRPPK